MENSNGIKILGSFLNARRHLEQATTLSKLTQGEFLVLRRIRLERDDKDSQKITMFKAVKISEYLSMPAPAISRILNSLEEQGYIVRNINANNRRSIVISLTERGRTTLEEAERTINEFASGLSKELGEKNSVIFIELLNKMTKHCEKSTSKGSLK